MRTEEENLKCLFSMINDNYKLNYTLEEIKDLNEKCIKNFFKEYIEEIQDLKEQLKEHLTQNVEHLALK